MEKFTRPLLALLAISSVLAITACDGRPKPPSTQAIEQQTAAANQQALIRSTPIPRVENSLERANLVERAKRINDTNLVSCITLFTAYGQVVAFYSVDGKVSSLNSYLQSGDQIIADPHTSYDGRQSLVVEAPDIDGAYGQNADGIFFYTADTNALVEWNGMYHWSDQCTKPSVEPLIVTQAYADAPTLPGVSPVEEPAFTTTLPEVTVSPN